jgi:hypothetical protein
LVRFSVVQSADTNVSPPRNVLPSASFSSISYVKVYANCRLRRIWVSYGPPSYGGRGGQNGWPAEFQLFGAIPTPV